MRHAPAGERGKTQRSAVGEELEHSQWALKASGVCFSLDYGQGLWEQQRDHSGMESPHSCHCEVDGLCCALSSQSQNDCLDPATDDHSNTRSGSQPRTPESETITRGTVGQRCHARGTAGKRLQRLAHHS